MMVRTELQLRRSGGKLYPESGPERPCHRGLACGSSKTPSGMAPWREVFAGNISGMAAPDLVEHDLARPGELAYWVNFDEPQLDANGDGPYRKAYIWARYLEKG